MGGKRIDTGKLMFGFLLFIGLFFLGIISLHRWLDRGSRFYEYSPSQLFDFISSTKEFPVRFEATKVLVNRTDTITESIRLFAAVEDPALVSPGHPYIPYARSLIVKALPELPSHPDPKLIAMIIPLLADNKQAQYTYTVDNYFGIIKTTSTKRTGRINTVANTALVRIFQVDHGTDQKAWETELIQYQAGVFQKE